MGRLSGVFSRSSGKESNSSSDLGRSWILVSRTQSSPTHARRQKSRSPKKVASSEPVAPETDVSGGDHGELPAEGPVQPAHGTPIPRAEASTVGSSGVEALPSSAIPGQSVRASGRLAGFMTLFRSRKHQRRKLEIDSPSPSKTGDDTRHIENEISRDGGDSVKEDTQETAVRQGHKCSSHLGTENETRKASDKTEKSVNSNSTSYTVRRRPSRRVSMPIITLADREIVPLNPFDDAWEASRSETSVTNPFADRSRTTTESTGQSSSSCSGSNNLRLPCSGHTFNMSGSSQSSWCSPCILGTNSWPTAVDRRLAVDSFNRLAVELYLDPLFLKSEDDDDDHTREDGSLVIAVRRRDKLLRRIRTMRSTMQIKAKPDMARTRSLRRMKTVAGLASRSCPMASLQGKPLESLARLGGYSFLTLPGDFAPATLSLPVCFVAIIRYLKSFALGLPNLFVDSGDLETATQTYDYFANQVLSAEKEKSKIQMTMRSSKMPSFLEEDSAQDAGARSPEQTLGIAFAFKALLEGLPGGLLGSMQLYRTLVNICYGRISQGSARRVGSCLVGLSPEDYAKVRAISLAILALTSSMQLHLICAVFGLCSLLLHETERISELERRKRRHSVRHAVMAATGSRLSVDGLGEALGPVLTEASGEEDSDTFQAIQGEIESQRVVALLIGNWRSVSRQLRLWEHRGLEARVRAGPTSRGDE